MNENIIENRINKLKSAIVNSDEAILLTNEVNIGYFCGFFNSEGYLLITVNRTILFVDFRYFEAAQKLSKCCEVICFNKLMDNLSSVLKSCNINNLYFEISNISLARYSFFKTNLEKHSICCINSDLIDKKISEIRIIKDKTEIEKIAEAQRITEKSYLEVLNFLKPGVTERKISLELEHLIKLNGGADVSFDLITITGKKTSLPHGVPSDDVVCEGDFFTFDIGSIYDGYHSDTTRTVAVKNASEEMQHVYNIVLRAQKAALNALKEGVKCSDIDKIARDIIKNEGFGEYFGHATGHGVGLEIHEAPTVSMNGDIILREGMVITDEPGIYLPNKFGVRIEDMVCVTKQGCENFVSLPKELIIV